jgi:CDP-diacylglycerol--glycerol-3-phosphate 3-phosphatidyltransferase
VTSALVLLAVAAAVLLTVTVATARAPASAPPGHEGFLDRWADLHGGYDPRGNRWVRGWLRVVAVVAAPLARRGVQPDVLSWWTVWLGTATVVSAAAGGRWPLLAGVLVVAAGLFDALDGAVAALTGRSTAWGYVLDSLLDRVDDWLFVVAVWTLGAPGWLAVLAGAIGALHEYLRARATAAGMGEVGVVTVGERPTRVLCCTVGLLGAGVTPDWSGELATVALGLLAALGTAGLLHLAVVVRRRL